MQAGRGCNHLRGIPGFALCASKTIGPAETWACRRVLEATVSFDFDPQSAHDTTLPPASRPSHPP